MIGCFCSVAGKDLEEVVANPKLIHQVFGEAPNSSAEKPSLIASLFGAKPKPPSTAAWQPSESVESFDVDKAWQGIHFLLTGSDWEGEGPLAFILHGGREIDEDLGYGSPHGFTAPEVKEIDNALQKLDPAALYAGADPAAFAEKEIYPEVWDREPKETCIGYVVDYLKTLIEFVHKTARADRGLIVYLG